MHQAFAITIAVSILLGIAVQAQPEPENLPPYIYYYSHLMGGLIVERADGTDSRHIAIEALPFDRGIAGIGGPGWSASGRYFATFGLVTSQTSPSRSLLPTVFDSQGSPVFEDLLTYITNPITMRWSPGDEDLLVLLGGYRPVDRLGSFIWLLDVPNQAVLAEIGINLNFEEAGLGHIDWDLTNEHVVMGVGLITGAFDAARYLRVTMQFDGTVIKQPVTSEDLPHAPQVEREMSSSPIVDIRYETSTSPSGRFEIYQDNMTNTVTGEVVALPIHSQSTMCRKYLWTPDEQYIIILSGTIIAGGGCGGAVMGVTDNQGKLWREIGLCDWDKICVGWLPSQVDVSALPPGQSQSVLLEPVRYDADDFVQGMYGAPFRADCLEGERVAVIDKEREEHLYTLLNTACPFPEDSPDWQKDIQVDYLPSQDMLATFVYSYVHIWKRTQDGFELELRLNSEGYELEFTEDGQYLRARNFNAWKVYAVEDILEAIRNEDADA